LKRRLAFAVAGFVLGFIVGGSFGVAGFGEAVSGSWIFSFCFAAIGWFFASSSEGNRLAELGANFWKRLKKID
jgi:hypothetical protein